MKDGFAGRGHKRTTEKIPGGIVSARQPWVLLVESFFDRETPILTSDNGTSDADSRSACSAPGTSRSGIGRPANRCRQGLAIHRVQRPDQVTRALSVAMPVSAYIMR